MKTAKTENRPLQPLFIIARIGDMISEEYEGGEKVKGQISGK
ncbi:hypothetical protein [Arthrospiribacter ruber]|nr:hypothetical protein [Arthrospiribacter ruber]